MGQIVTLLTDFGLLDGYPGVMKGVILGIAPDVQLVDVTHFIPPQNVFQGSIATARSYGFFPKGTIHVVVVDPGVGTSRRSIISKIHGHYFVGPDNGLITPLLEEADQNGESWEVYQITEPKYWLTEISNVFHGRDIYSPVAAHLANGVPIDAFGPRINDPIRLPVRHPIRTSRRLIGEVIAIDHFGNLSTNILESHLPDWSHVAIEIRTARIVGLVSTYGDRPEGTLVALFGTDNDLSISVVNGDAASLLNARVGDAVIVEDLVS